MTDGTAGARYRERPMRAVTDDTREALLAAAHDLLATEGPSGLTVRRIAAAAGVSTMNVYSRFGGKDGVLDELFVDGFRRLMRFMETSPVTDDPVSDLARCNECYRQFARENPTYYSLMFDRVVPDFVPSASAQETAIATLGALATHVQRAMDAGQLRPGDAFAVASALWACVHGVVSLELRTSDQARREFDWDVIAPLAVNALLRGLATGT
jgi:AcrR family transcriptional regulator